MKKLLNSLKILKIRHDIALVALFLLAIFMIIIPLPTLVVDFLIAINLMFSLILLITALYIRSPLEIAVFPSLLLITTLYRLALTISTSRLILLQHEAGEIVYAFGHFAVSDNLIVGLIVFIIITIAQFIVITKGAERVAEVSARFSLDGMPGRQMSIDGDLRAGVIDSQESQRLRHQLQKESQLYAAMDGAMKFVKGDAIAGILIVIVNSVGGVAVGLLMHGMSTAEALSTYTILSVGDGLVTIIPALLIAITAGIIVTRIPSEKPQNLADDIVEQVGRRSRPLLIAATVLGLFALLPGFPTFVFLSMAMMLIAITQLSTYKQHVSRVTRGISDRQEKHKVHDGHLEKNKILLGTMPLTLCLSSSLVRDNHWSMRLDEWRITQFERSGVWLPDIELVVHPNAPPDTAKILIHQESILTWVIPENSGLVDSGSQPLAGFEVIVQIRGHHLQRVDVQQMDTVLAAGLTVYRGNDIVLYCLTQIVNDHLNEFIGVQETRYLMDAMERRYEELVKELQRQFPIGKITEVLQRLVEEGVSIRDLRSVFETLVEWAPKEKDPVMLAEYARIGLRRHIVAALRKEQPWLVVWTVGERIENLVRESIRQTAIGTYAALDTRVRETILSQIRHGTRNGDVLNTALLTAIDIRRFIRKLIDHELPGLSVLSHQEVGSETELKVIGHIDLVEDLNHALA